MGGFPTATAAEAARDSLPGRGGKAAQSRGSGKIARFRYYLKTVYQYVVNSESPGDFYRLMKVRLAPSKLGFLFSSEREVAKVGLRFFAGDVYLRRMTSDIGVLNELMVSGGYSELFDNVQIDPVWIVDLGANIGLAARLFLKRYANSRVIAVEPESGNARMLGCNLEGYEARATIIQACVGEKGGRVRMETNSGEWGYRMVSADGCEEGDVEVVRFDDIIERCGPREDVDLLKCDIEGAEAELFRNCEGWINRIKTICIECHDPYRVENLMADLKRNRSAFDLVYFSRKDPFEMEVAVLRNQLHA